MAEAAGLPLPYPETGIVQAESLDEQTAALADSLPELPVVLGGCCCSHIGAARGLARRRARLGIVWFDAHGDLNTPETSPSGNLWGMPLRILLDDGDVAPEDTALVGARNLDPGEEEYLRRTGIDASLDRALAGVDAVYVALDADAIEPAEIAAFMPEPDGLHVADVEATLARVAARTEIVGIGVTGLVPESSNVAVVTRLLRSAGL
jgi:arginase